MPLFLPYCSSPAAKAEFESLSRLLPPCYLALILAAAAARFVPLLKHLSGHGKTATIKSNHKSSLFWIPKSCFRQFYVVGFFWTTAVATLLNCTPLPNSAVETTVLVHLLRRLYECTCVHKFHPKSKMHVLGWLLGVGHYVLLPFSVVGRGDDETTNPLLSSVLVALNLVFQFQQHRHHAFLAELRKSDRGATATIVPQKGWFRWVLCPHYLAEILVYLTWALMIVPGENNNEWNESTVVDWCCHHRHWFLFLWVATNLTVSSLNNYDWYKQRYSSISQSALIPFFL